MFHYGAVDVVVNRVVAPGVSTLVECHIVEVNDMLQRASVRTEWTLSYPPLAPSREIVRRW